MRAPNGEESGAEGFPTWASPAEQLRFLLRWAVLAPSRHNSQPWLFEIEGPELRVYGDARRTLRVADPQRRELVMACGAALYDVEVAARRFGRAVSVEVTAGGRKDGLLARLTLEERRAPGAGIGALFEAIGSRRTNRFGFDAREVPPAVITALVREVADAGARLRVVDEPLRPAVAALVAEADRVQWSSGRFRAELAAWSRSNERGSLDGIPGYAQGLSDRASRLQRLLLRLPGSASGEERRDRHQAQHPPALLALCTADDRSADWLAAGRAMQHALLRATVHGLSASYFSQAVEVPAVRARLREVLGERGWPQLLFRLGHGREVRATPRRPSDLVLRSIGAGTVRLQALARSSDLGASP
jgi:hypothetical protein